MNYYEILVGDPYYHGNDALTYSSQEEIPLNSLVRVPMRARIRLGIVVKKVVKPFFKVRPIETSLSLVMPTKTITFLEWLRQYYPGPLGTITQLFLPSSDVNSKKLEKTIEHKDKPVSLGDLPPLTNEQKSIVSEITESKERSFILHGDTGTGKTRLYIELAKQSFSEDKNVLILTPEIGLTTQLENSFKALFGSQVVLFHSKLTPAQRRDAWLRVATTESPIVLIGPRSALFAPFKALGLVVVDEAHETSYKQEQAPHYHGLRVSANLAKLHGARLIYGTATPLISEYYYAHQKKIPILRMTEQPIKHHSEKTKITVIQIRDRQLYKKDPYLSDPLLDGISQALNIGEQSLIFLNRRGSARVVICQLCGWQSLCPNCDLPLVYHADSHILRCHTCGHTKTPVSSCPVCSGTDIVFRGLGTKALEAKLTNLFPGANIKRFDADNLKADRLENNLAELKGKDTDIIVGTQLLAKGLDIPNLSMVGVVMADSGLYLPDFTAEEKTFQILSQVIGRVGRGYRAGRAVIQTYNPSSPPIMAAINGKWDEFYKLQLKERQQYMFPPFCYLLHITCSRKSPLAAEVAAGKVRVDLANMGKKITVIGPAPAYQERNGLNYRWQVVVKSKNRHDLLDIVAKLPQNISYNLDPTNLL